MKSVKLVLCEGSPICVLDPALDECVWLRRSSYTLMDDLVRSLSGTYSKVLVRPEDGTGVFKFEFVTMLVES